MSPKKESIQLMFDDISPKYDFLNHFLSMGTDFYWRKRLVSMVRSKKPRTILDVATGTGDLAIAMSRIDGVRITGIDISKKMLEVGIRKVESSKLADKIALKVSDAEQIPFADSSFDVVTVAFGVRNYEHLSQGIAEMNRVLKPGGCMLILEFSHPSNVLFRKLYAFYSKHVIPFFGKLISGHSEAYQYLPDSVAAFPSGNRFLEVLKASGMQNCSFTPLTFGIATIYYGEHLK